MIGTTKMGMPTYDERRSRQSTSCPGGTQRKPATRVMTVEPTKPNQAAKGLERRFPGQRVSADALDLHGAVEADVAEAESGPGDEAGDGAQAQKPVESISGTARSKTWESSRSDV